MTTKDTTNDTATGGEGEIAWTYYPAEQFGWNMGGTYQYMPLVYWVTGANSAKELDNCRFGPAYGTMLHLSSGHLVIWNEAEKLPKHLCESTLKAKAFGDVLEPAVRRDLDNHPELGKLFVLPPQEMHDAFTRLDHTKYATFDVAGRWEWVDRVDKVMAALVKVDEDEAAAGTAAPLLRKIMGKPASRRKRK